MVLQPRLEVQKNVVAHRLAPALLLARTALQDGQHVVQGLQQLREAVQGFETHLRRKGIVWDYNIWFNVNSK